MTRPFLLYHWSPVERRASIIKRGLVPNSRPMQCSQRWPFICFCSSPSAAWALSATHSDHDGNWDLWMAWSDRVGRTVTMKHNGNERWWLYEYRVFDRIPKSKLWHVGTRRFRKRKSK